MDIAKKSFLVIVLTCSFMFACLTASMEVDAANSSFTYYDYDGTLRSDLTITLNPDYIHVINEPDWNDDGVLFTYWTTEPDGEGQRYYPGQLFQADGSNHAFYANCTEAPQGTYTVTYHTYSYDDGGETLSGTGSENYYPTLSDPFFDDDCSVRFLGTEIGIEYPVGVTHTVVENRFTLSGMVFEHWNLLPEDASRVYIPGNSITMNADWDLYAIWDEISMNIGSGGTVDDYIQALEKVSANASGKSYAGSDSSSAALDGSTVGSSSIASYEGVEDIQGALITQLKALVPAGKQFSDDDVDDFKVTDPEDANYGSVFIGDEDGSVYIWTLTKTYHLTCDIIVGEGCILIVDSTSGSPKIIRDVQTDHSKDGYVFLGWYDVMGVRYGSDSTLPTPVGQSKVYLNGNNMNVYRIKTMNSGIGSGDGSAYTYYVPLFPVFVSDSSKLHSISFNSNAPGGSSPTLRESTVSYEKTGKIDYLPSPSCTGYTFDGWYTEGVAGDEIELNANVDTSIATLYAHWSAIEDVTVTFDIQSGETVYISGELATEDIVLNIEPGTRLGSYEHFEDVNTITKEGYTFLGWADVSAESAIYVYSDTVLTADMMLRAQWAADDSSLFTVTFRNGTDATVTYTTSSLKMVSGTSLAQLPSPVRAGHNFIGWYESTDAAQKTASISSISSDIELYAIWQTVPILSIVFETNNGDIGASVSEYVRFVTDGDPIGKDSSLPTPTPTVKSTEQSISCQDGSELFIIGSASREILLDGGNDIVCFNVTTPYFTPASHQGRSYHYLTLMESPGLISSSALISLDGASLYTSYVEISNAYNWTEKRLAGNGGAICAVNNSQTHISESVIDLVGATYGGAVYQHEGELYIANSTIGHEGSKLNTSTLYDGLQSQPTFQRTLTSEAESQGKKLIGCQGVQGAAIWGYGVTCILDGVSILGTSNITTYDTHHVGLIWYTGNLTVCGHGTYTQNYTTNGLFYTGNLGTSHTFVKDGVFDTCVATFCGSVLCSYGSAFVSGGSYEGLYAVSTSNVLYIRAGVGALLGGNYTDNIAGGHGSVVTVRQDGTLIIQNAHFDSCRVYRLSTDTGSNGYGGAVAVRGNGNGSIVCINSSFVDCMAAYGGAISSANSNHTSKIRIMNCSFDRNQASDNGGDVNMRSKGEIRCINSDFTGSTASNNGGSIYNSGGTTKITSCSIEGCQSTYGGGIYCGASLTLTDSVLESNTATYGSQVYKNGSSALTVEGSQLIGGSQIEAGTIYLGRSSATVVDGIELANGTVWIGPYTAASDITVTVGKIYVGDTIDGHETSATGLTLGEGMLYMGYNSSAQQITMDLSGAGELWIQKAATGSKLELNSTYFAQVTTAYNDTYNLTVIDGVLQTPEVRKGTITAAFTDASHILLTITGAAYSPSTVEDVAASSVLVVPSGGWNQVGSTTTYTCTAEIGSSGAGFTEVRASASDGYYNVYITISAASLSTSISSFSTTGHGDPGEGESYYHTGTQYTGSYGFVKMYQSSANATPAATSLELPILEDSAPTNKATFRGYSINGTSYLVSGGAENVPYSLPAGAKAQIVALWLNGNVLGDNGIYYEYNSASRALTLSYDADKATTPEQASPIMTAGNVANLVTELGSNRADVVSVEITNITVLPASVFSGFESLSTATLQAAVLTNIGPSVFKGCSSDLMVNNYEMDPEFTPILNLSILENSLLEAYRSTKLMILADIALTSTQTVGDDTILNLNGKSLAISTGYVFHLASGKSLCIMDSLPAGSGSMTVGSQAYTIGGLYNAVEDASGNKSASVSLYSETATRYVKTEQIAAGGSTVQLKEIADDVDERMFIGWSTAAADSEPDYADQGMYTLGASGSTAGLYGVYRESGYQASYQS
ncbi:MAG: InlB B-repeat-containing protein [Candidatus Methanomethylophilaceae archaeon]|nr:InlB B-repeat-containing protein [Candidatus Methanomethylophilaceae archaeon]